MEAQKIKKISRFQATKEKQMTPFYAIKAVSGKEHLAAKDLEALGLEVYNPTYEIKRRNNKTGKRTVHTLALYPSYMFARVPTGMFPKVRKQKNVLGWVAYFEGSSRPYPLTEAEIAKVRQAEAFKQEPTARTGFDYNVGDLLEVLNGILAGKVVTFFGSTPQGEMLVESNLMGAKRTVTINADVERVGQ